MPFNQIPQNSLISRKPYLIGWIGHSLLHPFCIFYLEMFCWSLVGTVKQPHDLRSTECRKNLCLPKQVVISSQLFRGRGTKGRTQTRHR
jgi:hypothetical protein